MSSTPPPPPASFPPNSAANNPYQPTAAIPTANYSYQQYEYRSIKIFGYLMLVVACCLMVLRLCMFGVELIGYSVSPNFFDDNVNPGPDEMPWLLALFGIGVLILLAFLAQAFLMSFFYYRSSANLYSIGVKGLEFTPGWAVGWWFVPIANLVKPHNITKEILQASRHPQGAWKASPAGLVHVWWGCYIGGNIVDTIVARLTVDPQILLVVSGATTIAYLIAGVCFIMLILELINLQENLQGNSGSKLPQQGFPPQGGQPYAPQPMQSPQFGNQPNQGYRPKGF